MKEVDIEIRKMVHFQQIVCQSIESGKVAVSEKIFHLLMLINKELEILSYCLKAISSRISTSEDSIVYNQINESFRKLRKLHMVVIELVYR